jgi:hypothetical protein
VLKYNNKSIIHLDFVDIIGSHPQATNADKPNPVWSLICEAVLSLWLGPEIASNSICIIETVLNMPIS